MVNARNTKVSMPEDSVAVDLIDSLRGIVDEIGYTLFNYSARANVESDRPYCVRDAAVYLNRNLMDIFMDLDRIKANIR